MVPPLASVKSVASAKRLSVPGDPGIFLHSAGLSLSVSPRPTGCLGSVPGHFEVRTSVLPQLSWGPLAGRLGATGIVLPRRHVPALPGRIFSPFRGAEPSRNCGAGARPLFGGNFWTLVGPFCVSDIRRRRRPELRLWDSHYRAPKGRSPRQFSLAIGVCCR